MSLEWDIDPSGFLQEIKSAHKQICEEMAIHFFETAVDLTPVYTGNLRASWKISVGEAVYEFATGGTESNPLPAPTIPTSIPGLPDFPVIFVTNGAPYADYVNDGGPNNAPVHMLERAAEAAGG